MSLIEKEKGILYQISIDDFEQNAEKDFLRAGQEVSRLQTYYLQKDKSEEEYLAEYGFDTPAGLMGMLERHFDDESERKMIHAVAAAAFKLHNDTQVQDALPEKIYNF